MTIPLFPPLLFLAVSPLLSPLAPRPAPQASAERSGRDAPLELELTPVAGPLRSLTLRSGAFHAPFLFDTGGGITLLSPASAEALGMEPFGRATGFRHDGTRVDGPRGGPITLSAGAYAHRGEVGVIDLGGPIGGPPPLGGIVALDFFRDEILTVDLVRNRLTLETPRSLAVRTQGVAALEFRLSHQAAGASLDPMVGVEGLHGTLWFELDCGNVAPVLLAPHVFPEFGLEPLPIGRRARLDLPILGLGLVSSEIEVRDLIYDGLLNAAFFERHVVTLDLARSKAWAKPRE